MYRQLLTAFTIAASVTLSHPASAQQNVTFTMAVSSSSCLPNALGNVSIRPTGSVEFLHVLVARLPANTEFELFVIQVPKSPFGLSWYQGDIMTDANGIGTADFVGRFSRESFIVAPGVATAPVVFSGDASSNPSTAPVQTYHLGLWFNSPADAGKAGCATTVTPFNGTHNAGIQVMNTSNFADGSGPLRAVP